MRRPFKVFRASLQKVRRQVAGYERGRRRRNLSSEMTFPSLISKPKNALDIHYFKVLFFFKIKAIPKNWLLAVLKLFPCLQ